ncbi:MAG: SHOCT domain-containing protein [Planctomycetes bacterium]|nr:SHOCT domain-containing protein [Planctomycetota bacterium]
MAPTGGRKPTYTQWGLILHGSTTHCQLTICEYRVEIVASYLGITGVFAGSRARSFRPASRVAAIVGAVGAGLYIVSLLIPTEAPDFDRFGRFGRSSTTIGLLRPFQLLEHSRMAMLALTSIVAMGLGIAACVICFVNVRDGRNAESLGRLAFWLLVADFLVAIVGGMIFGITAQGEIPGEAVLPILFMVLKMGCWVFGILLLTPVGLTDLIVNIAPGGTGSADRDDPSRRILRFQKMLDEGLITPEEFEKKRRDILSGM